MPPPNLEDIDKVKEAGGRNGGMPVGMGSKLGGKGRVGQRVEHLLGTHVVLTGTHPHQAWKHHGP